MKTVMILLVAVTLICMVSAAVSAADTEKAETPGYCGTKTPTPAVTTESGQSCEVQNIEGKIDSIILANPAAKDKRPVVTVVDNKDERIVFAVTPDTLLCGADMKPITLDAIKEGASVKVKVLCAREGEGVATSIYLTK